MSRATAPDGDPGRKPPPPRPSMTMGLDAPKKNGRPRSQEARLLYNRTKGMWYGKRPSKDRRGTDRRDFGPDRKKAERDFDRWKYHLGIAGEIEVKPLFEPLTKIAQGRARAERILEFWGASTADGITRESREEYYDWCQDEHEGLSDSTIRGDLKLLHAVVSKACAGADATYRVASWLPKEGPPRPGFFFAGDLVRFLLVARGRIRDPNAPDGWVRDAGGRLVLIKDAERLAAGRMLIRFVMLVLYTGSRPGVVRNARWDRNKKHGHFDLEDSIFYRKARGQRKTRKRARPVKLTPLLERLLDGWKRRDLKMERERRLADLLASDFGDALVLSPHERISVDLVRDLPDGLAAALDDLLGLPRNGGGRVLTGPDRHRRARIELVGGVIHDGDGGRFPLVRWWNRIREEAGLSKALIRHSLRKTCATWLIAAGVPDEDVSKFLDVTLPNLGHYYLIADVALTEPIADALDAFAANLPIRRVSMANTPRKRRLKQMIVLQRLQGEDEVATADAIF